MKIAINRCYCGFDVSDKVYQELGLKNRSLNNKDFEIVDDNDNAYRAHPKLIAVLEKIGHKNCSGALANIKIVEIPDDVEWVIEEYDGVEWVAEKHRTWC